MSTRLDVGSTVGQLVAERPARARVFEKIGIDYCCGGKKPFAAACEEKGLDARRVATMLDAAGDIPAADRFADAKAMTLTQLADHIEATHHEYLRRELPRIQTLLTKVVNAHGQRHPEVLEVQETFTAFTEEIASHMMKEERILFPAIRALDGSPSGQAFHCGSLANPFRQMEAEHDSAGDALARFRQLTRDYSTPGDVCNTYRALMDALADLEEDMHQHVHKENNILFPRTVERESQSQSQQQ